MIERTDRQANDFLAVMHSSAWLIDPRGRPSCVAG